MDMVDPPSDLVPDAGRRLIFLELSKGRCVNLGEIAAIEDIDPGPPYHSPHVIRTRVTLRCGTQVSSPRSYGEIRDLLARATEQ